MKPRLVLVDFRVANSSPSLKSWLRAAPSVLPQHFSAVEVWSTRCELRAPDVRWRKFPAVTRFWPVQALFFLLLIRLARSREKTSVPTIWQCTGEMLRQCDIRYIQFWNRLCLKCAAQNPGGFALSVRDHLLMRSVAAEEKQLLKGGTGTWWAVSRAVESAIAADHIGETTFKILPNAYDHTVFNHDTRRQSRDPMRQKLGIAPDEVAFVFSALGHFERKGLPSAADGVARLRARGIPASLHVFGGHQEAIARIKKSFTPEMMAVAKFHGPVSPMEKYLSAGDALLFPSRFEAFSLAEIEAAALGLRLYLTPHPGAEMILREPVNGRSLPWDSEGMAAILAEEIESRALFQPHSEMGEALDSEAFAARLSELYADAISRRFPS